MLKFLTQLPLHASGLPSKKGPKRKGKGKKGEKLVKSLQQDSVSYDRPLPKLEYVNN
jgi:hypothetical protein